MSNAQDDDKQQESSANGSAADQADRPNALFVLGMHRSGTSVLAGSLGLLGGALPIEPMGPAADNTTGFWEPTSIVRAHDELLESLGIAHDSPIEEPIGGRDIVEMIRSRGPVSAWVDRLVECVGLEFGDVGSDRCLVIKDPRMCRLMPLWVLVMKAIGRRPAVVMPVRNPVEVAGSLSARNRFPRGKSHWLWLDHVLRAEHDTREITRLVVNYEALLEDWQPEIQRLNEALGLGLSIVEGVERVDRLITSEHRHQIADERSLKALPEQVRETYQALNAAANTGSEIDTARMDELTAEFEQTRKLSAGWILQSERRSHELSDENERLTRDNTRLRVSTEQAEIRMDSRSKAHAATERELRARIESIQVQLESDRERSHQQSMQSQELTSRVGELSRLLEDSQKQLKSAQQEKQLSDEKALAERAAWDQTRSAQLAQIQTLGERVQSTELQLQGMRRLSDEHRMAMLEQQRLNAYIGSVHSSGSWRITKPLRGVSILTKKAATKSRFAIANLLDRTGKLVKHTLPLSESMEYRLESVLYGMTGPLLKHTVGYSNFRSRRNRTLNRKPASMIEPAVVSERAEVSQERTICDARVQGYDLDRVPEAMLFFGVIDWHFRHQRPQHIASGMGERGHRVFYLSPQFVNQSEPGYAAEEIASDSSRSGAQPVVQVRLHVSGSPLIYEGDLTKQQSDQIRAGISKMLIDYGIGRSVSMVQHPGWSPFAYDIPNAMLVYDCMDNHHGFADAGEALLQLEERLLNDADLTVVTSDWLEGYAQPRARKTAMVRNACQYQHFARVDVDGHRDPALDGIDADRTVIGYYGAIADWFDVELVERVAEQYPGALVMLIGADSVGTSERLSKYRNILMLGEIPYRELPAYVARMDVCLIPFVINDLIRATNPVKIYEMLAAGKPVVTTDLPELREPEIDRLVHRATNYDEFVQMVGLSMTETQDLELVAKRREYASGQDWASRSSALDKELAALRGADDKDTLVSIVVVTWNNIDLTKACLESVLKDTSYPNIEVVVVDNASTDETPEYLRDLEANESRVRVILNDSNTGFSRGNNIGLRACRGNYVVLLNNDTVVTHGWIRTMVNHLDRDKTIGILGVITNNIGNEARVETKYTSIDQMPHEAFVLTRRGAGDVFDIPVVAFFCCAMRREVYEEIGELDENFGLGFFEDDDYCQRVRQIGLRVCCANDIFVHHHLSASFNKIGSSRKDRLFTKNKEYYESKWGTWVPHCERGDPKAVKATAR